MATTKTRPIAITGEPAADALLDRDPFALLAGMLLDQQFPMERAFAGPQKIAERLGDRPSRPGVHRGAGPGRVRGTVRDAAGRTPLSRQHGGAAAGARRLSRRGVRRRRRRACGRGRPPERSCSRGSGRCPVSGTRRPGSSSRCWASNAGCGPPAGRRRPAPMPRTGRTARWPTSSMRTAWPRCARSSRSRNALQRGDDSA